MIPPTHLHPLADFSHTPSPLHGTAADVSLPRIGWKSLSSSTVSTLPQPRTKAKSKRSGKEATTSNTSSTPNKKKNDPGYIPRPPNSFILFRKHFVANRPTGSNDSEKKCLSTQAGEAWHNLSSLEKRKWAKKAHVAAADHARRNPNWKFKPTRKSDKLQAEPPHQSPPIAGAQLSSTAQLPAGATMPAALSRDNLPPPDLLRRRETFRLANWDDSVLSPHPRLAACPNDRLDQLHDSLRRRSSSVPIPETFYSLQGPSSFPNQGQMFLENPFPPTNMQHRLSYSGIRPGFMPVDIFGPQHHVSAEHSAHDLPLQPISSLRDDPPPSFEGYTIRVVTNPPASSAQHTISPLSRDMTPTTDFALSHFPNHAGFNQAVISQNAAEGISPRTIPPRSYVPTQTNSLREGAFLRTIPLGASPPMDSLQGNPTLSTAPPENPLRMESKAPAQRISLKPSSPQKEQFPFDVSSLDFNFRPYIHDSESLQLSGLNAFNGGHAVVPSNGKQLEPYFSESPNFNGEAFPDFTGFDEFVEMPYSAESSNPGSGAGSSPSSFSRIDFEAAFA